MIVNSAIPIRRLAAVIATALAIGLALAGSANGAMHSPKLGPGLCETTGGGRIVPIPDFPGEKIDRRLLTDIKRLEKRYKIFVTDGYSMDGVHAENGEHPIGLALDIVPNKAAGGRWSDIDRLAAWAEPKQNQPRAPFRWVGYNGDEGHGRGNHLHLSWSHTVTKPGRTARTVYTSRCPSPPTTPPPSTEPDDPPGGGTDVDPTIPLPTDDGSDTTSGGIGAKPKWKPAPPILETGGVAFSDR